MKTLTTRICLEVAAHEAVIRQAYKDSVGVWTWSVGITSASGHKVERYIDNPQPLRKCLDVWIWLMQEKYLPAVLEAFRGHELTEAQLGAALSFHWNTGAIKRASWVKKWKAGDIAGARKSFMDWRKPKAIIPRREKERDLFFDGKWSNNGSMTEYTKLTPSKRPDWGSAKRIDASAAISAILAGAPPVRPDVEPRGPVIPPKPDLPPTGQKTGGVVAAIAALFAALAAYAKSQGWW